MLNVTGFSKCFIPSWKMTLLTCLAVLLFSRLGFWQLHRADEKKQMQHAFQAAIAAAPVVWTPESALPKQYQKITVQGRYLSTYFLLDNQHMAHQFGYHVVTPLLLENHKIILIDRGWVKGDMTRQSFPVVQTTNEKRMLSGTVYFPSKKSWVLGDILEKKTNQLAVIEALDTHETSKFLHKSVYPFIIRLAEQEDAGFNRKWFIIAMPPERHVAYAIQWFAMALVVMILFIVLNIKKRNEHD